jgi:hypothetical protein
MLDFDPRDLDRNETRSEFDHDRHESRQHRGRTQNIDADQCVPH